MLGIDYATRAVFDVATGNRYADVVIVPRPDIYSAAGDYGTGDPDDMFDYIEEVGGGIVLEDAGVSSRKVTDLEYNKYSAVNSSNGEYTDADRMRVVSASDIPEEWYDLVESQEYEKAAQISKKLAESGEIPTVDWESLKDVLPIIYDDDMV